MNYHVLTLFPDMINQGLNTSIIGRALEKGTVSLNVVNIRDYAGNKHGRVDDYPYGGGAGMVMQPEPIYHAYEEVCKNIEQRNNERGIAEQQEGDGLASGKKPRVIYLTPQGKTFNQGMAQEFSAEEDLVFLCGHYEGVDERVLDLIVTDHVSIGDYVLTGGELAAMVVIDAISRLVPEVLNNDMSAEFETFHDHLLEYPQYTRPEVFMDYSVPAVLLSGHHGNVDKWRKEQSLIRTKERRPDLYEKYKKNCME